MRASWCKQKTKAKACHELLQSTKNHTLTLYNLQACVLAHSVPVCVFVCGTGGGGTVVSDARRDYVDHDTAPRRYVLGLGTTRGRLLAKMDQAKFRAFMTKHFKFPESSHRDIDAVHMMFDDEKSGQVPLRDMINAFAQVLTTSIEERASFYFDVYDLDGSGALDKNEVRAWAGLGGPIRCPVTDTRPVPRAQVMHMLLTASEKTNKHAAEVLSMLARLDKDCDGTVSLEEFEVRRGCHPPPSSPLPQLTVQPGRDMDDGVRRSARRDSRC